jgi:hypothetical protein
LLYKWELGDSTPAIYTWDALSQQTFGQVGDFTVTLTVTDPAGQSSTATTARTRDARGASQALVKQPTTFLWQRPHRCE